MEDEIKVCSKENDETVDPRQQMIDPNLDEKMEKRGPPLPQLLKTIFYFCTKSLAGKPYFCTIILRLRVGNYGCGGPARLPDKFNLFF